MGRFLTAEQIAEKAQDKTGLANIRLINKLYRRQDESHLWPISGSFSVTERAIRRAQRFQRESGIYMEGLEYALFLEDAMSEIVNNSNNW